MRPDSRAPGTALVHLAGGVPLLRPGEQVLEAMLEGSRSKANLAAATVGKRAAEVRAFTRHADAFPWAWRPQMLDEWLGDLRAVRGLRRSTIRNYALSVSAFAGM